MNALQFARELADFEERLGGNVGGYYCAEYGGCDRDAVAVSYATLLNGLVDKEGELDNDGALEGVVLAAIDAYRERLRNDRARSDERAQRSASEYAEAERRHELAVTVECPFCGAQPGDGCRTAGRNGSRYPKGIHDHRDRYRAATDPTWKRREAPDGG